MEGYLPRKGAVKAGKDPYIPERNEKPTWGGKRKEGPAADHPLGSKQALTPPLLGTEVRKRMWSGLFARKELPLPEDEERSS